MWQDAGLEIALEMDKLQDDRRDYEKIESNVKSEQQKLSDWWANQ